MPKTILVADDSVTIRRVVELAFHDTEIRVDSVGSGQEALERLEQARPDLVLADVVMPAPDGYELCKAVKGSGHPVPVLLLTGSFEPFDAHRAEECGADGHLRKPFESRALLQRVRELMERPVAAAPVAAAAPDPVSIQEVFDELVAESAPGATGDGGVAVAEPLGSGDAWDLLLGNVDERTRLPRAHRAEPQAETLSPAAAGAAGLSAQEIDALARAVVAHLSDRVLREIAWEVVPDLAEKIVRQRIRELESSDPDRAS